MTGSIWCVTEGKRPLLSSKDPHFRNEARYTCNLSCENEFYLRENEK